MVASRFEFPGGDEEPVGPSGPTARLDNTFDAVELEQLRRRAATEDPVRLFQTPYVRGTEVAEGPLLAPLTARRVSYLNVAGLGSGPSSAEGLRAVLWILSPSWRPHRRGVLRWRVQKQASQLDFIPALSALARFFKAELVDLPKEFVQASGEIDPLRVVGYVMARYLVSEKRAWDFSLRQLGLLQQEGGTK